MAKSFAFVVNSTHYAGMYPKYPWLRLLPHAVIDRLVPRMGLQDLGAVTGIETTLGDHIDGHLISVPYQSHQFHSLPAEPIFESVMDAVNHFTQEGASVIGLGAYTKTVGHFGVEVQKRSPTPITTGNAYTTYIAIQQALWAVEHRQWDLGDLTVTVLGATGSIGTAMCHLLLDQGVRHLQLVARNASRLNHLAASLLQSYPLATISLSVDIPASIRVGDLVIAVSSADEHVISASDVKPHAVILDVARPQACDPDITTSRPDVSVYQGGLAVMPGAQSRFEYPFGMPEHTCEACMAETVIIALTERWDLCSVGAKLDPAKITELATLGDSLGFRLYVPSPTEMLR